MVLSKNIWNIFFHKHFFKFLIVGGASTIINYGIFFVLYNYFQINYQLSSAIGYIVGALFGFFFNKYWTYESDSKQYHKEMLKYFLVYTVSLFMGLGLLRFLVVVLHLSPLIANVVTIGCTTITNFLGTKFIIFKK
jgi:putative flippase GtrA